MLLTWNDGMLEQWNNGQKIDVVPIVPVFHHANCERSGDKFPYYRLQPKTVCGVYSPSILVT